MSEHILVVDDEESSREAITRALERSGYQVQGVSDPYHVLRILKEEPVSLIITDLKMPGLNGLELLRQTKEINPDISVIVLTGYGTIESAVEAMKIGAYDYLCKPININEMRVVVSKALERQKLVLENKALQQRLDEKYAFSKIIGTTEGMKKIFNQIQLIAPSRATVLITGESGTGKELIAEAIHQLSPRRDSSLIKLHCAALAPGVLESELFGHEKGSFTGALQRKPGRFEIADGGTLFLDEVSAIPLIIQVKLLRVLQEQEFERVGGNETIKVDVRLIAATNRDLTKMVADGNFREDLYYRLKVITINVPPLRERMEDIPFLVNSFIKEFNDLHNKNVEGITKETLKLMLSYPWPGNIRELKNCIESMVVMSRKSVLEAEELPPEIRNYKIAEEKLEIELGTSMAEIEKRVIKEILEKVEGKRKEAARMLQIPLRTLQRKIKQFGLREVGR